MPKKLILFILVVALWLSGCASKSLVRVKQLNKTMQKQQFDKTLKKVQKDDDLYGKKNMFLWNLDQAVLLHYMNKYDSSKVYITKSEKILDDLYQKSVINESASILTNDLLRPYRSYPYEISAMYQIQMFNYLAQGDIEGALVEYRKAKIRFDSWFQEDDDKFNEDGMLQFISALAYKQQGEDDNAQISLYQAIRAYKENKLDVPQSLNDFAWYEFNKSNRIDDIKKFELVKPSNARLETQKQLDTGQEIIIIGYSGHIPIISESKISGTYIPGAMMNLTVKRSDGSYFTETIPSPIISPDLFRKNKVGVYTGHLSFAFPQYLDMPYETTSYSATFNNNIFNSQRYNDYSTLLKKHLDDTKAKTIVRTITRTAVRAAIKLASKRAINNSKNISPTAALLFSISADIGGALLEKADTRSCFLLPRTIDIIRIPVTNGIHNIIIDAKNNDGEIITTTYIDNIRVKKSQKEFIFLPSLR